MANITETKTVKIDSECKANPIYLTWLNTLGGYDYWLFDKQHSISVNTKSDSKYSYNVDDLENAIGTNDITGKLVANQIKLGARVKAEDMDGMESLYTSSKVMRLMNPETWEVDGAKWQRVIVKTGSLLVLNTNTNFLDVKLTIELANTFKQIE